MIEWLCYWFQFHSILALKIYSLLKKITILCFHCRFWNIFKNSVLFFWILTVILSSLQAHDIKLIYLNKVKITKPYTNVHKLSINNQDFDVPITSLPIFLKLSFVINFRLQGFGNNIDHYHFTKLHWIL